MNDIPAEMKFAVWHPGERALQDRIGVAERMEDIGRRVIRGFLLDQHRDFYARLPFIVAGSVDAAGDAWATLLCGNPGFLSAPSPDALRLHVSRDATDPANSGMNEGDPIGLLGIELHSRRRNRLNGRLRETADGAMEVVVDESFGNCPQYIQLRDYEFVRAPSAPPPGAIEEYGALDESARRTIAAADTFFVASYADREDRGRQVDVSHRGGKPGFVRVSGDGTLTIPDFAGNLFFNTLGNILLNGKAGLVFVDFERGDLLQMSGDAELVLDPADIGMFRGAERMWRFRARRIVRRPGALALRWSFRAEGASENALMTGDWNEADARRRARDLADRWRSFRVKDIVDESATVRSFRLEPDDGAGLAPYQAGQHLPIRLVLPGSEKPSIRTYTLSVAPSDSRYRISVKRDGSVSRHLHERIGIGDVIEARAPSGTFTIDASERRPAVLLAGGVGITPLLAMLRHIVYEGLRTRRVRPTTLFHSVRSSSDRPFDRELAALVERARGAVKLVRVLTDIAGAEEGVDYDASGRIDAAMLRRFLSFDDHDFYLCGPAPFMRSLYDGLRDLNVADGRIYMEAFGPSALTRRTDAREAPPTRLPPAIGPVTVIFIDSAKEARWTPGTGSLLELAEARGLQPAFSCRNGSCGSCRTKLLGGKVTYVREPGARISRDEVLICCAVPAQSGDAGEIRLAL